VVHINLLAMLLSAIVAFVIGALWYSPLLFGKAWMAAHGFTPEAMADLRRQMVRAYAVSFVCFVIMAFVLTVLLSRLDVTTAVEGAKIGFMAWLGFAATIGLTANLYSGAPLALYLIDVSYQLVYMVAMGAILAAWH
jgi:uncharacterized protein DUF1761